MKKKIIIIVGPTAVGKTKYAIEVAKKFNGEIISADSMQLYKYMDIGSAKPTAAEMKEAKHYLVDEIDPRDEFSVAIYQKLAKGCISQVMNAGKLPIISGGTGLYVNSLMYDMDFSVMPKQSNYRHELEKEALAFGNEFIHNKLKQLDPIAAERIHPNNIKKVIRALEVVQTSGAGIKEFEQSFKKTNDYDYLLIGLNRDREELYQRIDLRVDLLIEAGLVDEIKRLQNLGLTESNISMKGIGYKEIIGYLNDEYSLDHAIYLVKRNTRHYAKRQLTWFRRYPDIKWFQISGYESELQSLLDIFKYIEEN